MDNNLIEHKPWVGPLYRPEGINGQRIAIVGHFHHGNEDNNQFTIETVAGMLNGEYTIPFFSTIRNYFGFEDNGDFWNRVMFFNYLPDCVGGAEERYNSGTEQQIMRAKARFLRILADNLPEKVFVFSNNERLGKGWPTLPPTCEEEASEGCIALGTQFPRFSWGTYRTAAGHIAMAFGLRHPQGASSLLMRDAVEHILSMPNASS
jgi:hypothetical protein